MQTVNRVLRPASELRADHWIGGKWVASPSSTEVISPYFGQAVGRVSLAGPQEVGNAVAEAREAGRAWAAVPLKERCSILFRFRDQLLANQDAIAHMAALESGKTIAEGRAGLFKGIEVLEYALSLQNLDAGGRMEVSRGVFCELRREPLGVVAGITPFNFPAMVPMWMIPIAIVVGNAFIWKPSDKTPLTSVLVARSAEAAGIPKGVLTLVQGGREAVEALVDHPDVAAVGFVGSSPVARALYTRASAHGKRALCLGGAKNHVLLMPDADPAVAVPGIMGSFTGCAGQRCMAASAMLAVGRAESKVESMIQGVVDAAARIRLGEDMGAIITKESLDKLHAAIARAENEGARILLDGRKAKAPAGYEGGFWLGPTVLDQVKPQSQAACDELFGPVLSIIRAKDLSEAMAIENANPYGNACSVFTTNGAVPEEIIARARAGMIGVNIGVPVPREPFSFGGFYESRFGHGDITGEGGVQFWSQQKKITVKWALQKDQTWMS